MGVASPRRTGVAPREWGGGSVVDDVVRDTRRENGGEPLSPSGERARRALMTRDPLALEAEELFGEKMKLPKVAHERLCGNS